MKMLKRTWAEVDLDALRHNYETLTRNLPDGCRFLGVVKADAYGHGAVPVAKELQGLGAGYLAVSNYEEALQLRRADVTLPTLGGQTGLNLAMALAEDGTLEKYGVRLLGTSAESIRKPAPSASRRGSDPAEWFCPGYS